MNTELRRCLEDLEARIDPHGEDALLGQWLDFLENRFDGSVFTSSMIFLIAWFRERKQRMWT